MPRQTGQIPFTANARLVLEKRYLLKNDQGRVVETPEELIERVAGAVAEVEGRGAGKWKREFLRILSCLRFLPNSPTLMNAGKKKGQLSACFVLPVEDSLGGIFDSLKNAALIHQSGGGTGFAFTRLRPEGSEVHSTHGAASGPVSFMRIFDAATDTIKQGGTRRGANMAVLRVDHPDVLKFINSKRDGRSITNFNISVGVTDDFMSACARDGSIQLRDPRDGKPVVTLQARELLGQITRSAWECGDPGLVFLDRMNRMNPTPREGQFEATNPCGEQPLLPYESCNLGSMNVAAYVADGKLDWEALARDIRVAVRFLDNVIDANAYPVSQSRRITRKNRKIGLGVMGFADALLLMGIRYGSEEGVAMGERIMAWVDRHAKATSAALAEEKGAFPGWKGSLWERLGYPKLRNATVSTVAPTGTLSILAGVSSGIEPIFAGIFHRNVLSGERLKEVHPAVERILGSSGVERITEEQLGARLGPAWQPAHQVPVEWHVRMQAAFQRHTDSAVSKTINLPKDATVADVEKAYLLAYQLGCKGITVYRDKSRSAQVLEAETAAPGERCETCIN
jgi:ribonucleoside-diphosphate reductase alpha chain